jgi:hypothetical protein
MAGTSLKRAEIASVRWPCADVDRPAPRSPQIPDSPAGLGISDGAGSDPRPLAAAPVFWKRNKRPCKLIIVGGA